MENDGSTTAIIPTETKLFAKMARVMGIINRVPKSGTNAFHKYRYATADDVADVIREALAEVNLAFIVQMGKVKQETIESTVDGKQKSTTRTTVKFTFTFACGDTGAVISSPWVGQVDDNSDKAINKCATSAEKYFLMKTFIVSAGDEPDPDADRHTETARKITPPAEKQPERWNTIEVLKTLAHRSFTAGFVKHGEDGDWRGVDDMEALIAPRCWNDFASLNEAALAIKAAAEGKRIISDDGTNRKQNEPAITDPDAQALLTGNIPSVDEPNITDDPKRVITAPGDSFNPDTPPSEAAHSVERGTQALMDKVSADKMKQAAIPFKSRQFAGIEPDADAARFAAKEMD